MTDWNESLDQTLGCYANPPQPAGLEARILARAEHKRRRRILLIFTPLATVFAAAIVAAMMLLHETPAQRQANATITVTNTINAVAPVLAVQQAPRFSPAVRARLARPQPGPSAIAASPAPVFPAPLPLTAEERRMQALAHDNRVIVPPEEPEIVISQLEIRPLETNNPPNQGANDEQAEP